MSTFVLVHESEDCIGCQACEVHCKTNKGLGAGPAPCKIVAVGPVAAAPAPRVRFVFLPCFHCADAACLNACPTGAVRRRDADGIVFIEASVCIGCKSCIVACPWGAAQWDPETRKAVKCDLCKDRLDAGLQPACVTKCVKGCLSLSKAAALPDDRRRRHAAALAAGIGG